MSQIDKKTKHQAEAWCWLVTDLVEDYGLEHTEPGEVMLDQVRNFLRRKLRPTAQDACYCCRENGCQSGCRCYPAARADSNELVAIKKFVKDGQKAQAAVDGFLQSFTGQSAKRRPDRKATNQVLITILRERKNRNRRRAPGRV